MLVIGHRGASASHPENTIEAFKAAIDQGAGGVELDVRRTADDVLVVFHDAELSTGERLRDLNLDQLPPMIPTLAEALEVSSDLWVNIEIKNLPDDPDYDAKNSISLAVAGLVLAHEATHRVVISSFNIDSVRRIGSEDPSIPLGWIVWGGQANPASLVERAVGANMHSIHPQEMLVDRGFVSRAHGEGLVVYPWTVNDPDRICQLAELGVDGVMTDNPAMAISALDAG